MRKILMLMVAGLLFSAATMACETNDPTPSATATATVTDNSKTTNTNTVTDNSKTTNTVTDNSRTNNTNTARGGDATVNNSGNSKNTNTNRQVQGQQQGQQQSANANNGGQSNSQSTTYINPHQAPGIFSEAAQATAGCRIPFGFTGSLILAGGGFNFTRRDKECTAWMTAQKLLELGQPIMAIKTLCATPTLKTIYGSVPACLADVRPAAVEKKP